MTPKGHKKTPREKFLCQRWKAGVRGIEWHLTFEEWWAIWEASGKYHLRGGAGHNYVMARFGDKGPYHKDNVRICTALENNLEAVVSRGRVIGGKKKPANRGFGGNCVGNGKGWSIRNDRRNKKYVARIFGKRIGGFDTEQEARAAYLKAVENHRESLK